MGDGSRRKGYWEDSAAVEEDIYVEEEVVAFCEEGGDFQRQKKRALKGATVGAEGAGRAGAGKN